MPLKKLRALGALSLLFACVDAHAQQVGSGTVAYDGGATQDFDTFAIMGISDELPDGWYFLEQGSNANGTYAAGNGSDGAGNTWSYGSNASSERAFGARASNSLQSAIGAQLQNTADVVVSQIAVTFTVEQWRTGDLVGGPDRLQFSYSADATSLTTGTWTVLPTLDAIAPVTTGTADATLDGNAPANRAVISAPITGLSIAPGGSLWLRWVDVNNGGADDALAIDDVLFGTPVDNPPEIVDTTPANGGVASVNAPISITFSEAVTLNGEWIELACDSSGTRAFSDLAINGGPVTYSVSSIPSFHYDESCEFIVFASNVTDQDDIPDAMPGPDYSVLFTAESEPVDEVPLVIASYPGQNATNFPHGANLTVTFSEPVDADTAFTLMCPDVPPTPLALQVSTLNQITYLLDPQIDLPADMPCLLVVEKDLVLDLDGIQQPMAAEHTVPFTTGAEIDDYYAPVDASSCTALRTTLHNVIDDHDVFPYSGGTTNVWTMLEGGDQDPNNAGRVLDAYFNESYEKITDRDQGGNYPQGSRYNREHTWPRSYGFPDNPLGSLNLPYAPHNDGHMLFTTEKEWNANRGSRPFGFCPPSQGCSARYTKIHSVTGGAGSQAACDHATGNCNWVGGADGNAGRFEVWTPRKGDIARAVLYMDIRYEGGVASGGNTQGQNEPDLVVTDDQSLIVPKGAGQSPAYMGMTSDLIAWHQMDPPDQLDILRNDYIESVQGNRNPFVDHPEWVECLFNCNCTQGNQPPTIADAFFEIMENSPLDTPIGTVVTDDPDGDTLSHSITAGNIGGAFKISDAGLISVAQTAALDFGITPQFVLTIYVSDGLLSDNAHVTIDMTDVLEAAIAVDDSATVNEDAVDVPLDVRSNDMAGDDDLVVISSVGTAYHGNVTFDPADVYYTPNANYCGSDSVGYTLQGGSSATVTIDVVCVNDAPAVGASLIDRTAQEGVAIDAFSVAGGFDDIDAGDILTFSQTDLPEGLALDPMSGTISGTPAIGSATGSVYTVAITASDGEASVEQSFEYAVTKAAALPDAIFVDGFED